MLQLLKNVFLFQRDTFFDIGMWCLINFSILPRSVSIFHVFSSSIFLLFKYPKELIVFFN